MTKMNSSSQRSDWLGVFLWSGLCFMFLQLPALRPLAKYVPEKFPLIAPLFLVGIFGIYVFLFRSFQMNHWIKYLDNRNLYWGIILLFTAAVAVVYPMADGLKEVGRGSDDDDAMRILAENIAVLKNPYFIRTYHGNPLSPGPGWAALWIPIALLGGYQFLNPIMLCAAGLTVKKCAKNGWLSANMFLVLILSSLAVWEMSTTGTDLFALGLCFLCLPLWIRKAEKQHWIFLLAVLLGMISTSRIIFVYIPFLVGFVLWDGSKQKAVVVALTSLVVCVVLHAVFYYWSGGDYPPSHVFSKGDRIMTLNMKMLAISVCVASGVFMLRSYKNSSPVWLMWMGLMPPLMVLSLADLSNLLDWDFALWIGSRYFLPPMALFVAWCVSNHENDQMKHDT